MQCFVPGVSEWCGLHQAHLVCATRTHSSWPQYSLGKNKWEADGWKYILINVSLVFLTRVRCDCWTLLSWIRWKLFIHWLNLLCPCKHWHYENEQLTLSPLMQKDNTGEKQVVHTKAFELTDEWGSFAGIAVPTFHHQVNNGVESICLACV